MLLGGLNYFPHRELDLVGIEVRNKDVRPALKSCKFARQ